MPAHVTDTGNGDGPGLLRIEFPDHGNDDNLEQIEWDEFFEKLEEKNLAFLYQDMSKDGNTSRFFKFMSRDHS